jgi:exonuclease III
MKFLSWNIRGMGQLGRINQLREFLTQEKVDIIGIQETIKQEFSVRELNWISSNCCFQWNWIPARGHSGGILLGVKEDSLEVENWENFNFAIKATVRNKFSNYRWVVLCVYGPAQHHQSASFLQELSEICERETLPVVLGVILI